MTKQHELPEKKPKFTPRFTASMQWSYCGRLQYSSWPTDRNALHRVTRFERVVDVLVRAVGHVVAVLFEPVGERELEQQELAGTE